MFIFKLIKYNNTISNPFGVKFSPNKIYGLSIKGGRGEGDPPIPYDKIFYWMVIFMVVMVVFWLSVVVVW